MNEISLVIAAFTVLCAFGSVACALCSYRLSRAIYSEAKSDERIVFGPLDHPYSLSVLEHQTSVIGCLVFNKSRRKAYIQEIKAFRNEKLVEIAWGSSIDKQGDVKFPNALIGITDCENLYVRRRDGEPIFQMLLEITYYFGRQSLTTCISFDYIRE